MAKKSAFQTGIGAALLCVAVCAATASLQAQSYYGSLRGTVVDPNGGVVGSSKITMTEQATGEARSAISGSTGEFVYSEVVPATYSISVEAPGFKKFERKGIVVGTQQQISVEIKLEV